MDLSEDDAAADVDTGGAHRHHGDYVPELFPVNKPPAKRQRGHDKPPVQRRGRGRGGGGGGRGSAGPSSSASTLGTATIEDQQTLSSKNKLHAIERKLPEVAETSELLDARDVPDVDELYTENERALSQFIRLHPMLSLESTSERTLSTAAAMVDSYALPTRELETVSKTHDDLFFRRANFEIGERSCVNADKCVCRWLAIFRHGEETDQAFVCREFLLPSQLKEFQSSGRTPKTQGKCLMCSRYFTSYVYTLARNSPSFSPKSCISIQAFGNLIESKCPEDEAMGHSNAVGGEQGYDKNAMLYVDEKWSDTQASRGPLGTLLWRPVVRFKSSDYVFVKDDADGEYKVIQQNVSSKVASTTNFYQPPSSLTSRAEA